MKPYSNIVSFPSPPSRPRTPIVPVDSGKEEEDDFPEVVDDGEITIPPLDLNENVTVAHPLRNSEEELREALELSKMRNSEEELREALERSKRVTRNSEEELREALERSKRETRRSPVASLRPRAPPRIARRRYEDELSEAIERSKREPIRMSFEDEMQEAIKRSLLADSRRLREEQDRAYEEALMRDRMRDSVSQRTRSFSRSPPRARSPIRSPPRSPPNRSPRMSPTRSPPRSPIRSPPRSPPNRSPRMSPTRSPPRSPQRSPTRSPPRSPPRSPNIQKPTLFIPIEKSHPADLFTLRFRLLNGTLITHVFNKHEPIDTVYKQLKFDINSHQPFLLKFHQHPIICPLDTSISNCGIQNRTVLTLDI